MELKDAAFVKMRDSVSFYKKILMSMYLKKSNYRREPYIFSGPGPCAEGARDIDMADAQRCRAIELRVRLSSRQSRRLDRSLGLIVVQHTLIYSERRTTSDSLTAAQEKGEINQLKAS